MKTGNGSWSGKAGTPNSSSGNVLVGGQKCRRELCFLVPGYCFT